MADTGGQEFVKSLSKITGWMPPDIQPGTLNLRVLGSIPSWLTSFPNKINRTAGLSCSLKP
jgi:hypothetical protein